MNKGDYYECYMCKGRNIIEREDVLFSHPFFDVLCNEFYKCSDCKQNYHACHGCKDLIPDHYDEDYTEVWDDITTCIRCQRVFCPSCWQSTGRIEEFGEYVCEECEKLKNNIGF